MKTKELSQILRWTYCLEFDKFCKLFGKPMEDSWCHEKFPKMAHDFIKFFCDLDDSNQHKFVAAFNKAHDIDERPPGIPSKELLLNYQRAMDLVGINGRDSGLQSRD
jgi:hypothetical protein